MQALALQHHGCGEHAEQAVDQLLQVVGAEARIRELVAAETRDGVVVAQRVAQAVAADLEQTIAGGVAE